MAGKTRHYYAGGHTARGFHRLYDSNLNGLERIYILKGGSGTGTSTFIRTIGEEWSNKGFLTEWMHSSSDNDGLDGVIIPELKVGIVNGNAPRIVEPKAPGAIEHWVNLGTGWEKRKLAQHRRKIVELYDSIDQSYRSAYNAFAQALLVHDEWEKYYIENLDPSKANALNEQLVGTLFADRDLRKAADIRHRFLGAATPNGAVDYIPNLTQDIEKRYFLKGRPGSGKSTLLKQLASHAEARGFDVEIYHCGFDPFSLDMLIMREAGVAIFDSTAPHEHFPDRDSDEIIDTYERIIRAGTDEKYEEEIKVVERKYKENMKKGISYLAQAKQTHDELESYYTAATNFDHVDQLRDQVQAEIRQIESEINSAGVSTSQSEN